MAVFIPAPGLDGVSPSSPGPYTTSVDATSLPMPHRPEVTLLGTQTCLLVEQTRAIRREALRAPVGRLSVAEQRELDEALRLALALD